MFVNIFKIGTNPFFTAYLQSDLLGKIIFWALFATSITSWTLLVCKWWALKWAQQNSRKFNSLFLQQKNNPLSLSFDCLNTEEENPFLMIYANLKKASLEILNKNRQFSKNKKESSYLFSSDMDFLTSRLFSAINYQTKTLEKNLFILSTIAALAPLLGLLGTVWGILMTFSGLEQSNFTNLNQVMLGGLSLALTTTVLGLLIAIPALVSYNYLRNQINHFEMEMEQFATEALATVEINYRKVDPSQ